MSATVDFAHFKEQVLPLMGFLVVKIRKFDPVMGMLLVITSSLGGAYSNWSCLPLP